MTYVSDKPSQFCNLESQNIRTRFANNVLDISRREGPPDIGSYKGVEVHDYRNAADKAGVYQWHVTSANNQESALPLNANSKYLHLVAAEEMPLGFEKSFIAQVDRPQVVIKNWMEARSSHKQGHNNYPDVLALGFFRNDKKQFINDFEENSDKNSYRELHNRGRLPDELRLMISENIIKSYEDEVKQSHKDFLDIADFYAPIINKPKDELSQTDEEYSRANQDSLKYIINTMIATRKKRITSQKE